MVERPVTTERELRELYGNPGERAVAKERPGLNEDCRAFIAHAPFLVMGTAGADGRCDVSPKGDGPGFVHVIDDHHLAIPDRLGNNRLDGMRNILEQMAVAGKRPVTAIVVEVEQAFMHCARAFKRAGLWEPARWPDTTEVRSMQRMIWDLLPAKPAGQTVEQYERDSQEKLKTLY